MTEALLGRPSGKRLSIAEVFDFESDDGAAVVRWAKTMNMSTINLPVPSFYVIYKSEKL